MRFLEGKGVKEKRAEEEKSMASCCLKRSYRPSEVFLTVRILWFG
jgi:hypothetical protein